MKSVSRMKSVGNETEQLVLRSLVREQLGMVSRLLGLLIILLYLLQAVLVFPLMFKALTFSLK